MNPQTTATSEANGHSTPNDISVMTDEQILEIDPQPQDAAIRSDSSAEEVNVAPGFSPASATDKTAAEDALAEGNAHRSSTEHGTRDTEHAAATDHAASTAAMPTAPFASPEDVRAVAELYPGGLPQAKTAAERARILDDIDRAYYGAQGSTPEQARASRADLAQMMLREDPAAFREMVFAGLRALQESNVAPPFRAASSSPDLRPGVVATETGVQRNDAGLKPSATQSLHEPHLAAYAEFEKAANADLEKTVGGAIDRALHQALPNLAGSEQGASVRAGFSPSPGGAAAAPLQARLSQTIRQDVEKALQGDRQLGEQVAQILAGSRFDHETRAQVVRLINDRAQQLVPGAAKRALHDWTQATLAAHRSSSSRADAASSRREVATAAAPVPNSLSAQTPRANGRPAGNGRVNYRKLSDEQILDL
jgi:hypothetical protein